MVIFCHILYGQALILTLCTFVPTCFPEEELRKLREETNVDSLRQELDRERTKRLDLEQKMNDLLKTR